MVAYYECEERTFRVRTTSEFSEIKVIHRGDSLCKNVIYLPAAPPVRS